MASGRIRNRRPRRPEPARTPGRLSAVRPRSATGVTPDGRPGPTGSDGFSAATARYHLYVSLACPWAHRALDHARAQGSGGDHPGLGHALAYGRAGLDLPPGEGVIPTRCSTADICTRSIRGPMRMIRPRQCPVLWDQHTQHHRQQRIRPKSSACSTAHSTRIGARPGDYYPRERREEIDALNARIYADRQQRCLQGRLRHAPSRPYEEAVAPLFETLDWLEERLRAIAVSCATSTFTEADITAVHHAGALRCRLSRPLQVQCSADHRLPETCGPIRATLYQIPGIAATVNFSHIKRHYYQSHKRINPTGDRPGRTVARL